MNNKQAKKLRKTIDLPDQDIPRCRYEQVKNKETIILSDCKRKLYKDLKKQYKLK